jgi:hypothetical protein
MSAPEKREVTAATQPDAQPQPEDAEEAMVIRRPDEDIAHRPHLKVRPMGSRAPAEPAKQAVRGGTLFRPAPKPEEEPRPAEAELAAEPPEPPQPKSPVPPPKEEVEVRLAFATHRPPPPDEKAEKEELAAVTGVKQEREVPTALVLGIALIVVAWLCGIFIVRLHKKVSTLETRLTRLEHPRTRTAAVRQQAKPLAHGVRTAAARPR